MEEEDSRRPVPAPRRLCPEVRKLDYENVTVDLINKNLNINSENIHIVQNVTDKLPNNKLFITPTIAEENSVAINSNFMATGNKSILTETNDLYGPNANEHVPDPEPATPSKLSNQPVYALPTPSPRPRKPNNNNDKDDEDVYENTPRMPTSLSQNTGAISKEGISKPLRKAPELPPKTQQLAQQSQERSQQRHSLSSPPASKPSNGVDNSSSNFHSYLNNDYNATFPHSNKPKSASISSNESSDSNKFKSPSPGDLLKSLGATSKLLTESIGERVALKAKGAKHKFDKNFKASSEVIGNFSVETTSRLKEASNWLGDNLTLGKKDKNKMPAAFDPLDRPQTLPPNDEIFNSISFTSPLQRGKAGGFADLRGNEFPEVSYDAPSNIKVSKSDMNIAASGNPPSYEDIAPAAVHTFTRTAPTSRSVMVPRHIAAEAASIALSKQKSISSLNQVNEEESSQSTGCQSANSSRDSMDLVSPPMPKFPAPSLDDNSIYGKLNPIQPPVRIKRRKNYEQIQLRRTGGSPTTTNVSLRPNVDSTELHELNQVAVAAEREESILLREQTLVAEQCTPKPDRSESWEYFEESRGGSDCSSPEPVYANREATYGCVFNMATSNQDLLPPQIQPADRPSPRTYEADCVEGAVGRDEGDWVRPPNELIREFDPLLAQKSSTICRSKKSNQLLLLENLLEEDVYGSITADTSISKDDVSESTSEEDNMNIISGIAGVEFRDGSTTSNRSPSKTDNQMQIVHQNASLLSESMENILAESNVETAARPYLSRVVEGPTNNAPVDLSHPSQNRSQWFVQDAKPTNVASNSDRVNPFNNLNIEDGESPPSYQEAIGADGKPNKSGNAEGPQGQNELKSRAARFMNSMNMNMFSNVRSRVDALKRKTSFKAAGSQRESTVKVPLVMVSRPGLSPLLVRYEGQLVRFPSGVVEDILKEMQHRRAILRDRQFQTYQDQEMKTPKEIIPLENITTVQCVSNNRVTDSATRFYCFEITTTIPKNTSSVSASSVASTSSGSTTAGQSMHLSNPNLIMTSGTSGNCKHQRTTYLYGVGKESERDIWMQKLLESLTNSVQPKYTCHYYRAGWCYLKNSITSEWSGTWLVLKKRQRRLMFVTDATSNIERMDLRKGRCIVLKESDETIQNLHVESGPTLMIDCPPYTVYMIMSSARETKIWRHIILEVAHNNGFAISDQQLNKYNVPVIVDKCINFVYIHGSMSEGIYRKSGSENSIAKLMNAFRADAFNVEITRNEYNEHDVANVLKRFMRDLPERLLGKLAESFICVSELNVATEKIPIYKELLSRLGVIERETLRKIVGHLAFISSQKSKNKMSVQNLCLIWGPTLLKAHQSEEMVYSQKEADVLSDLIMLFKNLFPQSADEMKKELEMLMCLQKYYAAAETLNDSVKKSGDLKMWITINPNPTNISEEKDQINVTISPTKTAYEICKELAVKMNMPVHEIALYEVILNGSLERPLHYDTKVFDVVLNWSYWPEDDRKNNNLVVKPLHVLREVQRAVKNMPSMTPGKELKFADNRTKSFKTYQCELRDGKIVISRKDKNDKPTIVREIFLHNCTAYLGYEKKRDFPWCWGITFIERNQTQILRSREAPFIGHVLAGSEYMDRVVWYASIWYFLYGESILPPAEIILK